MCGPPLIEAAWAYRHRPGIGVTLSRRQAGASAETRARSWTAQQRLCAKHKKMTGHGKPPAVAVVALARELAGFVWAEMTSFLTTQKNQPTTPLVGASSAPLQTGGVPGRTPRQE